MLWLIAPQQTIEPLMATFSYSREDPYAIRISFHVGRSEPVEWYFARDLLSSGVQDRAGIGDVTVWPSAGPVASAAGKVVNIALSSPSGRAHFGATAKEITDFLRLTYQVVPAGEESEHVDAEAELNDLLRQAS
ncbi:MAG TPA: SsgA family sporulation/cell division regulator [Trebonia sp.]|nr:SsgA family sporulation/cell division regulator [Trebonia sp.]